MSQEFWSKVRVGDTDWRLLAFTGHWKPWTWLGSARKWMKVEKRRLNLTALSACSGKIKPGLHWGHWRLVQSFFKTGILLLLLFLLKLGILVLLSGKIKVGCSRYPKHTDMQLAFCKVFMGRGARCVPGKCVFYWAAGSWTVDQDLGASFFIGASQAVNLHIVLYSKGAKYMFLEWMDKWSLPFVPEDHGRKVQFIILLLTRSLNQRGFCIYVGY